MLKLETLSRSFHFLKKHVGNIHRDDGKRMADEPHRSLPDHHKGVISP